MQSCPFGIPPCLGGKEVNCSLKGESWEDCVEKTPATRTLISYNRALEETLLVTRYF